MSNGDGDHQKPAEDHNVYQMVEDFLRGIGQIEGVDYTDVVMAMLAGAARLSLAKDDSLELFQAQSVVAYERMKKILIEATTPPKNWIPDVVRHKC